MLKNKNKAEKPIKGQSSDNPLIGWFIISALCIVAFFLDVPFAIIAVAIIGYAISQT